MEDETLEQAFDRTWPWIEAAAQHEVGGAAWDRDHIREMILTGECQLWPLADCVAVTRIDEVPARKYLNALWLGGSLKSILHDILPALEKYGRDQACEYIVGVGRSQWLSAITQYGFSEQARVYAKPLPRS